MRVEKEELATVEALARVHTKVAVKALAKIAKNGQSESAVVAAANAILDRGYGRPAPTKEQPPPYDLGADLRDTPDIMAALDKLRAARKLVVVAGRGNRGNKES